MSARLFSALGMSRSSELSKELGKEDSTSLIIGTGLWMKGGQLGTPVERLASRKSLDEVVRVDDLRNQR